MTSFLCSQCEHNQSTKGEIRAAGGFWSKLFNVQTEKYNAVSCAACGFTQFYKDKPTGTGENLLDFFIGG